MVRVAGREVRPDWLIPAGLVLVLAGGFAVLRPHSLGLLRAHASPAVPTSTAPVVRTDVAQQVTVTGTLGYAGNYSVTAAGAGGMLTWLPAIGERVTRGRPMYELNGVSVPLLYSSRPAWRTIGPGASGPDVRQLAANLAALGYGSWQAVGADFDWDIAFMVRKWQQAAGLPVTGTVPLGQAVFLPGPALMSRPAAAVGDTVRSGMPVLDATSSTPDVAVQLDPNVLPTLHTGTEVTVTLQSGLQVAGVVAGVSNLAVNVPQTGPSDQQATGQQAMIPVTIRLKHRVMSFLDQAQVQVAITSAVHRNVLAVPVTALLARPNARFVVVVVSSGSRRTVPVQAGLFDETVGLVEIRGTGLAADDRVEVPSQ